jgi:hypothetical protein
VQRFLAASWRSQGNAARAARLEDFGRVSIGGRGPAALACAARTLSVAEVLAQYVRCAACLPSGREYLMRPPRAGKRSVLTDPHQCTAIHRRRRRVQPIERR